MYFTPFCKSLFFANLVSVGYICHPIFKTCCLLRGQKNLLDLRSIDFFWILGPIFNIFLFCFLTCTGLLDIFQLSELEIEVALILLFFRMLIQKVVWSKKRSQIFSSGKYFFFMLQFSCLSSSWVDRRMKDKKYLLEKISSSWILSSCSGKKIGAWNKILTQKNLVKPLKTYVLRFYPPKS